MKLFSDKKDASGLEKSGSPTGNGQDVERRLSTTVGGMKMNRIAPPAGHKGSISDPGRPDVDAQQQMLEMEADNAIQYRTCSWPKTAALLFSEYICLAIMSFPYSYSVLGLVPGIILTVVQAAFVLYTSLITWLVNPLILPCNLLTLLGNFVFDIPKSET